MSTLRIEVGVIKNYTRTTSEKQNSYGQTFTVFYFVFVKNIDS